MAGPRGPRQSKLERWEGACVQEAPRSRRRTLREIDKMWSGLYKFSKQRLDMFSGAVEGPKGPDQCHWGDLRGGDVGYAHCKDAQESDVAKTALEIVVEKDVDVFISCREID